LYSANQLTEKNLMKRFDACVVFAAITARGIAQYFTQMGRGGKGYVTTTDIVTPDTRLKHV
jgi:hypothetical protein